MLKSNPIFFNTCPLVTNTAQYTLTKQVWFGRSVFEANTNSFCYSLFTINASCATLHRSCHSFPHRKTFISSQVVAFRRYKTKKETIMTNPIDTRVYSYNDEVRNNFLKQLNTAIVSLDPTQRVIDKTWDKVEAFLQEYEKLDLTKQKEFFLDIDPKKLLALESSLKEIIDAKSLENKAQRIASIALPVLGAGCAGIASYFGAFVSCMSCCGGDNLIGAVYLFAIAQLVIVPISVASMGLSYKVLRVFLRAILDNSHIKATKVYNIIHEIRKEKITEFAKKAGLE